MDLHRKRPANPPQVAFFNFDNTLFDNHHALTSALVAVRDRFPQFVSETMAAQNLVDAYAANHPWPIWPLDRYKVTNNFIHWSWGRGPGGADSPYGGYETFHPSAFMSCYYRLRPPPNPTALRLMAETYKDTYRGNLRLTLGALETLVRMKEAGCQIVLHHAPWGQPAEYEKKAEALGIRDLVDRLVPTSVIGETREAIMAYCSREMKVTAPLSDGAVVWVVGSRGTRFMPANNVPGLKTYVVREETRREKRWSIDKEDQSYARQTRITCHTFLGMRNLLGHLGLAPEPLHAVIVLNPYCQGEVIVKGLGVDVVTRQDTMLHMSMAQAQFLVSMAGIVLVHLSHRRHEKATRSLQRMIRAIRKAAKPRLAGDDDNLAPFDVSYRCREEDSTRVPMCRIEKRRYSFRGEHQRLLLPAAGTQDNEFRSVLRALEKQFSAIMLGRPQIAICELQQAIDILRCPWLCIHARMAQISGGDGLG